jgi:hypothetical protein
MSPSRVDPNRKQAKSLIDQVEEDPFYIDRMARTVSAPSQATVHLARRTPQELYYECLDEGEARQFPTPNLLYEINMQTRYAAAWATVTQYTPPVLIPKNKYLAYGDSDEDSDDPPPSPTKTDATEMKIDESLQVFIAALSHFEPLHYGFKLQASNQKGYCFCSLAKCLTPWRKTIMLIMIIQCVGQDIFKVLVFFNTVTVRVMNITQQLTFLTTLFKMEWD